MTDLPAGPAVGAKGLPSGEVEFVILQDGAVVAKMVLPAEHIGGVVATLLAGAKEAATLSGQSREGGGSVAGVPCFVPTRIGLTAGEPPEPHAISIHAGMARVGFSLETTNIREFAETLLAASAPGGRPQ